MIHRLRKWNHTTRYHRSLYILLNNHSASSPKELISSDLSSVHNQEGPMCCLAFALELGYLFLGNMFPASWSIQSPNKSNLWEKNSWCTQTTNLKKKSQFCPFWYFFLQTPRGVLSFWPSKKSFKLNRLIKIIIFPLFQKKFLFQSDPGGLTLKQPFFSSVPFLKFVFLYSFSHQGTALLQQKLIGISTQRSQQFLICLDWMDICNPF